jgi:DNA polymerase-3 subunit epsilon
VSAVTPPFVAVFDTETGGVDVTKDCIVTAFVGLIETATGNLVEEDSWLVQPNSRIHAEATKVHGITAEHAKAHGLPPKVALAQMNTILTGFSDAGVPIVAFNARFDFSILRFQYLKEFGWLTAKERAIDPKLVIDPYVIDKALDPFRKGSRILTAMAPYYGIPAAANAHDARADCIMAGALALKLLEHPRLASLTLEQIHRKQILEAGRQATSLEAYFRKKAATASTQGDRESFIEKADSVKAPWPYIPYSEEDMK